MSRKRLTLKEKSLIIEESSKSNFDKAKICKDFGINLSTLYKILKKKESILSKNDSKVVANGKKTGKIYNALHDLESIVLHDKIENSSKNQTIIFFCLKNVLTCLVLNMKKNIHHLVN